MRPVTLAQLGTIQDQPTRDALKEVERASRDNVLFSATQAGAVPASDGTTTSFLRADGVWIAVPSGYVHMYPASSQGSSAWQVFDPYGNAVSTAATTTQGLQEAITAGFASNWGVLVTGPGTITCSTAVTVPAGYFDYLIIDPYVSISFAALGSAALFTIDSQENCVIHILGQIIQATGDTGPVVTLAPTHAAPTTGNINIAASWFKFNSIAPKSTGAAALQFDPTSGGIIGNHVILSDPNGGVASIKVLNPGSGVIAFEHNTIESYYMHGASAYGVQIGSSTTNAGNMRENVWRLGRVAMNGASSIAFSTYGSYDRITIEAANNEEGTLDKGIVFQSGSVSNFAEGRIRGSTTADINDSGTGNLVFLAGKFVAGAGTGSVVPSGTISAQVTSAATIANTTETDLQTYTLPANSLNANGRGVKLTAWGTFAANANNKTVKLYFGGTVIVTSTALAANNTSWYAQAEIYRTGSGTQAAWGHFVNSNSEIGAQVNDLTKTDTAGIIVKVTGQNGTATANDIVCKAMIVEFYG